MSWVYEQNRMIRGISMVKPLDSLEKLSILPFWNGHSAGHWEGETLIIQSAGFNESTFVDATGLPHSDQLMTPILYTGNRGVPQCPTSIHC